MAFPQPNAQREIANRKILEELQLKKQLLLKQGVASTLNSSALPVLGSTPVQGSDGHSMNSVQRAALQTANTQSTGFFISQDSSFVMFPCLKLKHIEERLQCISEFEKPKILLEQYVTPSHLGSHMLYTIQSQYGDIGGKLVADLGSGCGALSVGAAVLDAALVVGFEIDSDALSTYLENVIDHEVANIDAVQCDVLKNLPRRFDKLFNTVLMNPPFGTKHNAGIDMKFLETALRLSNNAVYSLHKSSTRDHVLKYADSLGAKGEVLAELRYDLPSSYKFHKKNSVDIKVDFYRFLV
ncbi:hypothetical protein NQ314_011416 [Rhamnusium bicolor]|uniref:Methyltransferase small domain-containing protein n=1 Tax=Rhamnusium bicolor TaxID=1586634 RepID=A0AAV8XKS2_9CUCU|nr:hypothetical protein NQ314_011416 [Rhamnusium bicolor]